MGFYSSLSHLRTTKPPPVTPAELAGLVESIAGSGLLIDKGLFMLSLRFGEAIDQDDRDTVLRNPSRSPDLGFGQG